MEAAQASMKRHIGGSIPTGIPKWGLARRSCHKYQEDGPILSLQATAHDALTGKALGNNPSHLPDCMGGTTGLYYLNR